MTPVNICQRVTRGVVSFLVTFVFLAASTGTALAQSDALIGTWKLNLAKSKFSPGPAPKSQIYKYEAAGQNLKVTVETIAPDGTPARLEAAIVYDGKDHPVVGSPDYDTAAFKRIDANTVEVVLKQGGKIVQHVRRVLSSDGKVLTITSKGVNAKGQDVDNVAVYEKQ